MSWPRPGPICRISHPPRQEAEKQITYFEATASRMTHATFRSQGLFIGSGIIEAGCKSVVAKRLKTPACSGRSKVLKRFSTSEPLSWATALTPCGPPKIKSPLDPP